MTPILDLLLGAPEALPSAQMAVAAWLLVMCGVVVLVDSCLRMYRKHADWLAARHHRATGSSGTRGPAKYRNSAGRR